MFLNGTSSSGKSSISTELKNQKDIPFYHLSIDDFFNNYNEFVNKKFPDEPTRKLDAFSQYHKTHKSSLLAEYTYLPLISDLGKAAICYFGQLIRR